jgi:hypothetical protein
LINGGQGEFPAGMNFLALESKENRSERILGSNPALRRDVPVNGIENNSQ